MAEQYPFRNFYHIIATNAKSSPNKTIIYDGELKINNQQLFSLIHKPIIKDL